MSVSVCRTPGSTRRVALSAGQKSSASTVNALELFVEPFDFCGSGCCLSDARTGDVSLALIEGAKADAGPNPTQSDQLDQVPELPASVAAGLVSRRQLRAVVVRPGPVDQPSLINWPPPGGNSIAAGFDTLFQVADLGWNAFAVDAPNVSVTAASSVRE